MGYFECNLPRRAPDWLNTAVAGHFQKTLTAIHGRMERLEDALRISGLDGATFAKHAKVLFDHRKESFDHCSAQEIAAFVQFMDDGTRAEPRLDWPNAVVVVDTAFVTTREWEDLRHFGIGGSDAAVVLGISPYQNASSLYHNKVGTPVKIENTDSDWVFDRGHFLEEKVIEAFCKTTGAVPVPETRMFASKKHPCCTANIDKIVRFSDGRLFVFEAKTTIAENWQAWSADKIPAHYVPQTRQYPAVLDDDRICGTYIGCVFTKDTTVNGVYVGSDYDEQKFVCRFVERDKDAEVELLKAEAEWFENYVEMNEAPPMSGKPDDPDHPEAGELQVMRRYTGHADPQQPIEEWDSDEFEMDVLQYLEATEEASAVQKRLNQLKEAAKKHSLQMIDRLGTTVEAHMNNGDGTYYEIKYAPRKQTRVDGESLSTLIDAARPYIPPEMAEKLRGCITVTPDATRVFSIRQKQLRAVP